MKLSILLLATALLAADAPKLSDTDKLRIRELQLTVTAAELQKAQAEKTYAEANEGGKRASEELKKVLEGHRARGCEVQADLACKPPADAPAKK